MESGSSSRLSAKTLTELNEQVTRILKSCEGQWLELHLFKQVYKKTFGKNFDAHYRQLKSKKLKDVMKCLDSVTVLEQSDIIKIILKDKVEDSSMSPGHVTSVSRTDIAEESISSVSTTHSPPLSPFPSASFQGSGCGDMHVTSPKATRIPVSEIGKTDPFETEKYSNEGLSLPLVGYERLLNEMSAANTGTPVTSSPHLSAEAAVGKTSVHNTSTATGLLSDKELTEIKENATRILESCDGKCLELQRFKKVYRDTFGKRFLTPKKLEKVKSALDDVILLEQVGKKINIKLRNQAEKRSDSAESSQSVSDNLNESAAAVENEPSLGDTTSVLTPQKPALSPISAAACKVSNLLPLPLLPLPTQLNGTASFIEREPPIVIGATAKPVPSLLEIMDQQQREISTNEGLDVPPIGYERLLNEKSTQRKGTPVLPSPQLNPSRVRKVGTPGPFEKSINHAQQITGTITPKTSRTDCSLQEVNKAAEDIITSLSEEGKFVSLEEVKARLCKEFGKANFRAFGFRKDNAIPALHELIQLQAKVSLFVHAYVMTNSICTLHELNQSLADLGSKSDFDELKLGPLLQQPVVYDMFKPPSDLPSLPNITTIQILKHLEKYMTQEDLWRTKVDLKLFLDYLCEQYDCDTPYELGVRIQSVGLAISVIKKAKKCESERWKTIREEVLVEMDKEIKRNMQKIQKDLLGQKLGDLRSCVMKFLDVSPVDALNEIFQCSMQLFSIKHQKKISEFLTIITKDSLGRQLFQLALAMSCKRLLGDTFEQLVANEVQKQVASAVVECLNEPPTPPSEGKVVEEVKQWLAKADHLDLTRLARIEGNVVSKFPEFNSFEELGYGSFLKFLSSHKELQEATEQVSGFGRSERKGTMFGHPVSLHSVLDFVSQFGTQTSHEIIERTLCTYYGINKVTDLEFGSFSNILKKAKDRKKDLLRSATPLVVYEVPYICQDSGASAGTEEHNSSVLGYMSREDAIAAIRSTPLLEDVALWTHWDEVYGGDVSKLGDLKSFLENEEILINAGKSSTSLVHGSALAVMESSPGVLLRVTTKTSTDIFRDCACHGDPVGAAGHLVSMVMMNGGVANTPVALLSNHVQYALAAMAFHDRCCNFVLQCLVRMPRRLAQAVGMKVFYEPLNKLVGSTEAPLLLLSNCSTQIQRSRLHQLGFALGISQWIENFHEQVSGEDVGFSQVQEQKRPIAVVKPVPSSTEQTNQLQPPVAEDSLPALENVNDLTVHSEQASIEVDDEEDAVTVNVDTSLEQSPSVALGTENEDECKEVIEQIRREEFGIGLELGEEESKLVQRQREREGRGLHRLSTELYSRDTHFVLELVQNADDNSYPENISDTGYPSLVFVLERDKIVVLNNEVGFMENNIRALCDVGRSTKGAHRYGYIGQKGIGFKSVFRVSDCPEIHSNGFHIRFDAKSGSIGYILPQWIEQECQEKQTGDDRDENTPDSNLHEDTDAARAEYARWSTCIVLPLKEQHQGIEKTSLAARFRDVHPSLLLFLHRLRSISIQDKVNNICRDMIRKDLSDNIMEISHSHGTDRWLVIKKQLDASHMKEDVEMTELALGFPLFDEQNLSSGRRHQKLPQQHVFAYLPLRSYGFRFIIQGDFEVPSSREDVDKDKSWNQWLREEIPQLFVDALSIFMEHSSFSRLSCAATYFQFIPLEEEILGFFTPVAKQILTLLQGKSCVPATLVSPEAEQPQNVQNSYEWVLPCEAIFCDDPIVQQAVSASKLKEHLGLRYLHPGISAALNPTLRSRLGIETLSSKHLIEVGKEEVKKRSLDSDLTISDGGERKIDVGKIAWVAQWLQCMYRSLDQERNSSQDMLDMISSLTVIPLTDGTFVDLKGDCVFLPLSMKLAGEAASKKKKSSSAKSNEQTYFSVLERDLSTVHPALFSSLDDIGRSQVEQLLRRLGVKSLSARDLINSHILPTLKSDKWKTKSKEVLRSYLVYILEQRLSDPSVCDINELRSCVQIWTNKGPVNPTNNSIYFTKKFGNTIDLARQLSSISWILIDESYLDSCTGSKARIVDWKAFLSELGVQHCLAIKRKQVKLHRNNMAQTPWASNEAVWQTTPDGCYVVEDYACEEFEEFLSKIAEPTADRQSICCQSTILAQWIDERWDSEYSQYADASVRVKDSNDHVLGETCSSFYLNLVLKPWMSASDGQTIYIPRDLFIWNEAVGRLLEDHVKYSAADLKNSRFVKTLQIHESVTVDGMISEMKKWSTASSVTNKESPTKEFTTSLAHMSEVYSFLYDKMVQNEEQRKKVCDAFLKNALVFVPFRSASTSCIKPQLKHKLSGSFHVLKDVCWRDPTEVALKLLRNHGKVTTKHLLEGFYHSLSKASGQQSLATFFVDQLKVDETPNVDEYLEMASTVAELAVLPSPLPLNDMLKVFAILGRKCIARGHRDSVPIESEVDVNMASFIRQSLDTSLKCIFPSSGKWVSLSDKPLLLDNKSLGKIFQKESGVHFIDVGDFFQDLRKRSTVENRKFVNEKEEMKHNVSLFLKACDIQRLSECVKRDFTPTLVKYQCVPLQKYFHQMIPAVQRFLYFKKQPVYEELKNEKFAEKLQQMQFASVEKLETVYSLSTHPDIHIVIEEKSGVEPVGSSFCFYVAEEHQENYDVLHGEMVKLLRVKRQDSSDLSNFLVAVKNYSGGDFEFFLEEVQGLDPLPDEEEPWCVPPPQVLEEVVQEASKDVVPSLNANISFPNRVGDDGLHSWPPKSSAQFDKTLKREAELNGDNTLKMWPPPAPPDSVKKSLEEKVQIQGRPIQPLVDTERPNDREGTREPDDRTEVMPRRNSKSLNMEATNREENYQTSSPNDPNPVKVNDVTLERVANDSLCDEKTESVQDVLPLGAQSLPNPERICTLPVPACDARQTSPPRAYLSFNEEASEVDYDDLSFNDGDLKVLNGIQLGENPNSEEVGRWGERCVYEFLLNQVLPSAENVDIIWLNEEANTTAPYDFEIRRHITGVNQEAESKTVITYIEVKTTSSDQKEFFEISVPELRFALEKKEALHLYRVFNAGKPRCLRIRRLKNLASHLEKKNVKLFMAI